MNLQNFYKHLFYKARPDDCFWIYRGKFYREILFDIILFFHRCRSQLKDNVKESARQTANYYLTKAQNSNVIQQATKHLDNMVTISELILEMWLPSDVRSPEDIQELEIAEADEDKGVIVRTGNLKNRAVRRGKKKLMTYKTVQATVDNVSAYNVNHSMKY